MASLPPFFFVRPDETVLLRLRAMPSYGVALAVPPLGIVAVLLAAFLASARWIAWTPLAHRTAFTLAGAAAVLVALVAWRRAATAEYVVTDARVYARVGRLRTQVHFTTHDKVTDLHYKRGPLDALARVGHVVFVTPGGSVRIAGVADPLAVKEAAEVARDRWVNALLARAPARPTAGRAAGAAPAAASLPAPAAAPPFDAAGGAGALAAGEGAPAEGAPGVEAASELPAWTGARPSYVREGDAITWLGKPRVAAAATSLFTLAGAAAAVGLGALTGDRRAILAFPFLLVAALALVTWRVVQLRHVEYVVTDKRVYARAGVVGTTVKQLTYDKITDITYSQDVAGRLLGYGGLTVNTAGRSDAPVTMVGLSQPLDVKELIERARGRGNGEEA